MMVILLRILVLMTCVLRISTLRNTNKKSTLIEPSKQTLIIAKISDLNPNDLLESITSPPKIYMQATLHLKRLCDQPICHRIAAHLLMNNCKGLDQIDEQNYQAKRGQLQQDQVDAFAATLTMCDMERAKFEVPEACNLFTSVNLMRAAEITTYLEFSSQQVNDCLQGLGKNAKHWATWLSYRDSALLFCRAARLSFEKDESIALHRELIVIMGEFTRDLRHDLENLKENIVVQNNFIESMFRKVSIEVGEWKLKFDKLFGDVSQSADDVHSEINAIIQKSAQVRFGIENIFSTIQTNGQQIVADHKHDMESLVMQQNQQLESMRKSLSSSELHAVTLGNSLPDIQKQIIELHERQKIVEEFVQGFTAQIFNASILLQDHREELERASLITSNIYKDLEKASLSSFSLSKPFLSSFSSDFLIVAFSPLITLFAGNYGLKPTMIGNFILILSGLISGCLTVVFRHWEWLSIVRNWIWHFLIGNSSSLLNSQDQSLQKL